MNSHPPPRRALNVGSILLTPQENECLFGYLGRKCAVSFPVCLPLAGLNNVQVRSLTPYKATSVYAFHFSVHTKQQKPVLTPLWRSNRGPRCSIEIGDPSDSFTFFLFTRILKAVQEIWRLLFIWFLH